ncbi:CBS domain-containing protein [Salinigranum halophilum]|jgi:CBS domain-containing protein|uniref:CBS domain-containing protein n=1 Tax=Salinigranum halophilum TaxID=2565931 RepID=UPI0010A755F7|nr:CBS domain-containing protein [Salinigranum halophilum]
MCSDIARTDVLTAAPDTTVVQATDAMRTHDEAFVVVLDEQHPLGVLSAADVGLALGTADHLADRPVADLVSTPVTVRDNASREGLLSRFRETGTERLVVVDAGDEFVGVVSRRDLLRTYADEFGALFALFSTVD